MLLALLLGVLSTGIDLLADHGAAEMRSGMRSDSHGASEPRHLVAHPPVKQPGPCSVCFFHKLLHQIMVPSQELADASENRTQRPPLPRISVSLVESTSEGIRGPPAA